MKLLFSPNMVIVVGFLLTNGNKNQHVPSEKNVCFAKTASGKVRSEAGACICIGCSTNGKDVESNEAVVLPATAAAADGGTVCATSK
jgi:hypothetical protein